MTVDAKEAKPLLVYDGDCKFCTYWVNYWHKLTGDSVSYKPYQQVATLYPEIPIAEYRRAVQYITPDREISSGAEASFKTVSHGGKNIWLLLYKKLPGFAFISEKAYSFVSKHRDFFYKPSQWLWGRNYEPPKYDVVSWLFLRGLGLIFLIAFYSFGMQALGLIGSQGIIPVADLTSGLYQQYGALSYWALPMVFWISASDFTIQLTCWGGALLSLLLIFNIIPRISLILLFILYLSLCCAGQMFMTFQWDMFLLEAGVLTLFLYGWTKPIGIWLLRWLLFRFIFVAGMVKIMSGDETWRHLSALSYYFNTAPLPTPLAWYAHHLPPAFLTFSTGAALFVELVMPFLIFFPRRLRFVAAFAILFMQCLISLTGNYNFFNLQTMLLCLILFDDAALRTILPAKFVIWVPKTPAYKKPRKLALYTMIAFVVFSVTDSITQFYARFYGRVNPVLTFLSASVSPLRIINTYGPFAVITTKRTEIIFEGSNDGNHWVEYNFKYKPGDVNGPLKWNIPSQPRLDWQMWFAALGYLNDSPWVLNFMQRLLENSPHVMALLAANPFPDQPPHYVRALVYDYQFTSGAERAHTGAIWNRTLQGSYTPVMQLDSTHKISIVDR
jgi:predicted DCC family thiol-disulfide oxidoreductase YuxK